MKFVITVILIFIFSYLFGSFVTADFNISRWPDGLRYIIAILVLFIIRPFAIDEYTKYLKEKNEN